MNVCTPHAVDMVLKVALDRAASPADENTFRRDPSTRAVRYGDGAGAKIMQQYSKKDHYYYYYRSANS